MQSTHRMLRGMVLLNTLPDILGISQSFFFLPPLTSLLLLPTPPTGFVLQELSTSIRPKNNFQGPILFSASQSSNSGHLGWRQVPLLTESYCQSYPFHGPPPALKHGPWGWEVQTFMHARQVLYWLSYCPSSKKTFINKFFHNTFDVNNDFHLIATV